MLERRQRRRNRTYLGGVIEIGGFSTVECLVRDLNEDGARLVCQQIVTAPDTFILRIANHDERHCADLVWRARGEMGVRFVEARASAAIVPFKPRQH